MNFVQAEFWWKLLGYGVPLLGVRAIAGQMGFGKSWIDRSSLLMLSLLLFWNLSPLSFAILCLEGVISYRKLSDHPFFPNDDASDRRAIPTSQGSTGVGYGDDRIARCLSRI